MNQKLGLMQTCLGIAFPSDVPSYVASSFSLHRLVHANSGSGMSSQQHNYNYVQWDYFVGQTFTGYTHL